MADSQTAAATEPAGVVIDEGMPEIMSMTDVAALYGCSRQGVHKMIMTGKLPARRAGTTWVVRREVAEGITVDGTEVIEPGDASALRAPARDTPTGQ